MPQSQTRSSTPTRPRQTRSPSGSSRGSPAADAGGPGAAASGGGPPARGCCDVGQRSVELVRVVAEPAPPREMVGPAARYERPERRAVAEYAKVGELVDHDGLQCLGRREHEPPREAQPTLPRGTAPAAALIANADGGRPDSESGRMRCDRRLDRGAGSVAEPRLQHRRQRPPVPGGKTDDQLVAGIVTRAND